MNNQFINSSIINQSHQVTTYLVFDDNKVQLVQISIGNSKPVIFLNEDGKILQATPLPGAVIVNRPFIHSSKINGHYIILSNSKIRNNIQQQQQAASTSVETQQLHRNCSQTITTVHTSSSFEKARHTLTNNTAIMTTKQLTSNINSSSFVQPNSIISTSMSNGNTLQTHQKDISPICNNNNNNVPLDNRRPSRSYEYDPFTNKRTKICSRWEPIELTTSNKTTPLLIPEQTKTTTTFINLDPHINASTSLSYPNQLINHRNTISDYNSSSLKAFSTKLSKITNETKLEHVESSIIIEKSIKNHQPTSQLDCDLPIDPRQWTINQVAKFILRLTNDKISQVFYQNEISGQALLLMTEGYLRTIMKINLGPSLTISHEIVKLRERVKTFIS
ncbi:unnamed protein product [Rotaria sp. Silwood1]|nr:unnamed protein product [Rotaria sp. Silwood1]CAF0947481.1 unnamed protein product [Rotaria sp. Silwood1]